MSNVKTSWKFNGSLICNVFVQSETIPWPKDYARQQSNIHIFIYLPSPYISKGHPVATDNDVTIQLSSSHNHHVPSTFTATASETNWIP